MEKIPYHNYDMIFKALTEMFREKVLSVFGLETAPIVSVEKTELAKIEIDNQKPDFIFHLADDTYLHLEFQATAKNDDLLRFLKYNVALFEKFRKPITTVVIYGAGINTAHEDLSFGAIQYHTQAVFMNDYDGDTIFKDLYHKIEMGKELTEEEELYLIFLPLMRSETKKSERAIEAAELAIRVSDESKQFFLLGSILVISDKFIDPAYTKQMLEVLKMNRIVRELYEEGRNEGVYEGKMEMVRNLLKMGLDIESIVKASGLPKESVERMKREMKH